MKHSQWQLVREGRVGFSDYDNKYDLWNVYKLDGDWGKNYYSSICLRLSPMWHRQRESNNIDMELRFYPRHYVNALNEHQMTLNGLPFFLFCLNGHGALVLYAPTVTQRGLLDWYSWIAWVWGGLRNSGLFSKLEWITLINAFHPSMSLVFRLPNALWPILMGLCLIWRWNPSQKCVE